jgi:hydrogenase maturation protein HypF
MEAMCDGLEIDRGYRFSIANGVFDPAPLLNSALEDLRSNVPASEMAAAFHHAVADLILNCALQARDRTEANIVGLSGGVFQNTTLLKSAADLLSRNKFKILTHRKIPPNDGGLALGQVVVARTAND